MIRRRPLRISDGPADEWSPAIAIDRSGRVHVAYDTYQAGNYDVMLRTRGADGTLGSTRAVASSPKFEARPSVAADPQGRVWVAYEERTANWGKDAEHLAPRRGDDPLSRQRRPGPLRRRRPPARRPRPGRRRRGCRSRR